MDQFRNLFQPIQIGKLELKNRIVMLAMTTGYGESDETVSDRLVSFFTERAKGGAGLIIVPFSPVRAGSPVEPGLYDDRFIPGATRKIRELRELRDERGYNFRIEGSSVYRVAKPAK